MMTSYSTVFQSYQDYEKVCNGITFTADKSSASLEIPTQTASLAAYGLTH